MLKDIQTPIRAQPHAPESFHEMKIPDRYNGEQLTQTNKVPFQISLDWLTINLKLASTHVDIKGSKYFDFEDTGNRTKIFKHVIEIYYTNEKFATLTFCPFSSALDPFLAQLQLANEALYLEKEYLFQVLDSLLLQIDASFVSVNRLDVALDFPEDSNLFFNPQILAGQMFDGSVLMAGREKKFNIYTQMKQGGITTQGMSWGDRSSGSRYVRLYNKTEELKKNFKAHIVELHAQMNAEKPIWRLECQLGNKFFRLLPSFGYADLFKFRDYIDLIQISLKGFFEFHLNTGASQTNKNPKIELIKWLKIEELHGSFKSVDWSKEARKVLDNPHESAKRTIKANFREYYKEQDELSPIACLCYLAEKYQLEDFFLGKVPFWLDEFRAKRKILNSDFDISKFWVDWQDCLGRWSQSNKITYVDYSKALNYPLNTQDLISFEDQKDDTTPQGFTDPF